MPIVGHEPEQLESEDTPQPKPARFIWPPRRIDVAAADREFASEARRIGREEWGRRGTDGPGAPVEIAPQEGSVGAIFDASPPTQSRQPDSTAATVIPPPSPESWNAFEHAWLGVTSEPWARRREIVAFDAPGAACWRCASPIGVHESTSEGCSTCRGVRLPWDRLVRIGAYEGELRDTIREVKFKRFAALGVAMGADLGRALARTIDEVGAAGPYVLVPVAMPLLRRLRRGVDHTKAIAVGAARELRSRGVDARVSHLLARRHRPSQLEVAPSRRFANAAGSFVTAWPLRARGWLASRVFGMHAAIGPLGRGFAGTVIVIDDVRTTGATMAAACRQMRRVTQRANCPQAKVWGAVVAVASHRGLELG